MAAHCAWCGSPRQPGPVCPECGADYAKAEAIKSHGKAAFIAQEMPATSNDPMPPEERSEDVIPVKDPHFEKQVCLFAMPAMLLIALLVQVTGILSSMQRIFFAMPLHELGHAVTGWLCGYNSIPTLWKTITPAERGYLSSLLLVSGLFVLARYGVRTKRPGWVVAAIAVVCLQIVGTFLISPARAEMLIIIGGDAMGIILAAVLMAIFYSGKDTQLYKGCLRWGFLGIGAAAFMNMFVPWWKKDISAIGYGLTGGEPTDSWKMINVHLWDWDSLFTVHITTGLGCLLILAVVYALGLKQARQWVKEKERQDRLSRLRKS